MRPNNDRNFNSLIVIFFVHFSGHHAETAVLNKQYTLFKILLHFCLRDYVWRTNRALAREAVGFPRVPGRGRSSSRLSASARVFMLQMRGLDLRSALCSAGAPGP